MHLNVEDPRDSFISPRPMMATAPHPTPQVILITENILEKRKSSNGTYGEKLFRIEWHRTFIIMFHRNSLLIERYSS